jgi:hypothetical protein
VGQGKEKKKLRKISGQSTSRGSCGFTIRSNTLDRIKEQKENLGEGRTWSDDG